jgi:hypothetical protein
MLRVQCNASGIDSYALRAGQHCPIADFFLGRLFGVTKHFAETAGRELRIFRRGRVLS